MAGHKPHIRLIKGLQPPVWVCKGQGRWNGHGGSPQDAYRDWGGRSIDIGRYAGYGGARPDKEIVTYVGWWLAVWERLKFIAAVTVPAGLAISGIVSWLGGGNG